MKYLLPAMLALASLIALSGSPEARTRMRHTQSQAQAQTPENFVQKVAASNQFEIDSSRLALQKSKNDQIKQFAQRMIDDHTKLAEELKDTLKQANMPEPSDKPDPANQAGLAKLQKLNGAVFNRAYVAAQVRGNEQAVRLIEGYSKTGQIPALKQLASTALPIIQDHLRMAEQLPGARNLVAKR